MYRCTYKCGAFVIFWWVPFVILNFNCGLLPLCKSVKVLLCFVCFSIQFCIKFTPHKVNGSIVKEVMKATEKKFWKNKNNIKETQKDMCVIYGKNIKNKLQAKNRKKEMKQKS